MNKITLLLLAVFCIVFSFLLIQIFPSFQKTAIAISPLPKYLSASYNSQVTTLNIWRPVIDLEIPSFQKKPEITAESAIVYDITTNKVLYAKNPKSKYPMASLTKITTAIVALEHPIENDVYLVEEKSLVGEDSMGLTSNETLTLKELLYGLLLPSGNDASEVLAENSLGRKAFISAMNDKAKSLGLIDTNYTNPSGLQGDGDQYTTAYDLLVITRYALSFSLFKEIVSTPFIELPYSSRHKYFYLENETNLLTSYPGVKGVKTGFTPEAGLCLVTYYKGNGHELIGILLGSVNRREEMKNLLDYSLQSLGVTPPQHG